MEKLRSISTEVNRARVGSRLRVLVESPGVARSEWDAPEIDGVVRVPENLPVGDFADVVIRDSSEYDLIGL